MTEWLANLTLEKEEMQRGKLAEQEPEENSSQKLNIN